MDKRISTTDATRKFSRLLRSVREGCSYVVTNHGRPVARFVPVDDPVMAAARTALLNRLKAQPAVEVGRWTGDELYERRR